MACHGRAHDSQTDESELHAFISLMICCEPAIRMRASELTVTKSNPLAMRARATSVRPLCTPGLEPVRMGTREDVVDGLGHRRIDIVEHRRAAQRQRQIRRADVDRVDALDRADRIQVVERLRGLDHREDDDVAVGLWWRSRRRESCPARTGPKLRPPCGA